MDNKEYVMYFDAWVENPYKNTFRVYLGDLDKDNLFTLVSNPIKAIKFNSKEELYDFHIKNVGKLLYMRERRTLNYDLDYSFFCDFYKAECTSYDRAVKHYKPNRYKSLVFEYETRTGKLLYLDSSLIIKFKDKLEEVLVNDPSFNINDYMISELSESVVVPLNEDTTSVLYNRRGRFEDTNLILCGKKYNDFLSHNCDDKFLDFIIFSRVYRYETEEKSACLYDIRNQVHRKVYSKIDLNVELVNRRM